MRGLRECRAYGAALPRDRSTETLINRENGLVQLLQSKVPPD